MSDTSNFRPEGPGYNTDAGSYSTPQVSSSVAALAGSSSSLPHQATPLATTAPSSSCRPPQSKAVNANINRCGNELSERDLVDLRSCYAIPSSVILRCSKATERANAPPPTCLLAGVNPMVEFFLTSFSQRTQKDEFLYFEVKSEMKGFHEAFFFKGEPETWMPFFFLASGLPRIRQMQLPSPPTGRTDAHAPTLLHRPPILKETGHFPIFDVDLGALEALRVSFNVPDHSPLPPAVIPTTSSNQLPLR
ncbi:hypothetical protein LIER_38168 [Lithospermum erythrorhizon]|uniref:Uncharacterized protein n=1 Tax=Lithospermum erythrorhizon TaxID=34254 RepID=A0AAV3PVR9_LITER